MNTREIRELFTRFFEERGHRRVPSSSLIPPPEERTMLFTTAGMVQMKPYFMGLARPPGPRLTSIQKCFRTSDVEEVGDGSHHTFFEMLGNFSVGDYFKAEVIPWAWELLTLPQPQGLGLSKDRLWATIFQEDEEAFELWRKVGVPPERIVRYGEKDNYWFMGAVGPCGPNTEINYDFGEYEGWQPHACHPNCEEPGCRRFLELWNLVFMTLFQAEDGSRRPLPQRNVDTGAGLERWPAPLLWEGGVDWQGKPKLWTEPPTNYDSDLFQPILARVGELAGVSYDEANEQQQRAMRVVTEHARAATFLIADGVTPANDGRGYVLRRLIRRAVYFGKRHLSEDARYMVGTSDAVVGHMKDEHPDLLSRVDFISRTLDEEEERFGEALLRGHEVITTLKERNDVMVQGLRHMIANPEAVAVTARRADIEALLGTSVPEPIRKSYLRPHIELLGSRLETATTENLKRAEELPAKLTGETIFVLWDTFGLPPDVTRDLGQNEGFEVDLTGFEAFMGQQRARSRASTRFEGDAERIQTYVELALEPTEFVGYETTRAFSLVSAIVLDGTTVVRTLTPAMASGHRVEIVLDQTPFYAEGGGQVGDRGEIVWPEGRFVVEDTQAVGDGGVVAHVGRLEAGSLSAGDPVEARVDESLRADTMRNHTATHLLHAALRQVVGQHVRQAGSLVTPDRLRFDFTHLEALTPEQIARVEALANEVVRNNLQVNVEEQSYEDALKGGALAFFGDKYADVVRVVGVCERDADACFSRELCGGTHVHASGDVGAVIITSETSIGAGLRRLEAVSGRAAAERIRQREELVGRLGSSLLVPPEDIESRLAALREENDRLRKQLQATERRLARSEVEASTRGPAGATPDDAIQVGETVGIVRRLDVPSADAMRAAGDALRSSHKSAVILLASVIDGKPTFLAMASPDVAKRCPAGDVVRAAAQAAGGSGGGRPEIAQGGGTDPSKVDAALAAGRRLIEEKLGASS